MTLIGKRSARRGREHRALYRGRAGAGHAGPPGGAPFRKLAADAAQADDEEAGGGPHGGDVGEEGWCARLTARHDYNNRMWALLRWDMAAFTGCACLFGLLVALVASTDGAGGGATAIGGAASAGGGGAGAAAGGAVAESSGWDWRVEVSFFLVRTLYALSAFPFAM